MIDQKIKKCNHIGLFFIVSYFILLFLGQNVLMLSLRIIVALAAMVVYFVRYRTVFSAEGNRDYFSITMIVLLSWDFLISAIVLFSLLS